MKKSLIFLAGGLSLLVACASLDAVDTPKCGNHAIERDEDCDTFPVGGTACRAAGEAGECRLDCRTGKCPPGWGCGVTDKLCRAPSGLFEAQAPIAAGANKVVPVDFDGDGRVDAISHGVPGGLRTARARLHFFDDRATTSVVIPTPVSPPHIARLDGDGTDDIAVSVLGMTAFLGNAGRDLQPLASPSYTLDLPDLRIFPAFIDKVALAALPPAAIPINLEFILALATDTATLALLTTSDTTLVHNFAAAPLGDVRMLSGSTRSPLRLLGGSTSACGELVAYVRGGSSVTVLSPCDVGLDARRLPVLVARKVVPAVSVPTTQAVERVLTGDVDGDGKIDLVIVGKKGAAQWARNTGVGFDPVKPLPDVAPEAVASTLAIGDFNRDGKIDYVTSSAILLSQKFGAGGAQVSYVATYVRFSSEWVEAIVADFDGDGLDDVAARAEGQVDVDFFSGVGRGAIPSAIGFDAPILSLNAGDFDGDGLADLVAVEDVSSPGEGNDPKKARARVNVVFGRRGVAPSQIVTVVESVTGLRQVVPVTSLKNGPVGDDVDDLALVAVAKDVNGKEQSFVTIAFGSADRLLFAPLLAPEGVAAEALVGRFRQKDKLDFAALAQIATGYTVTFSKGRGGGSTEFESPLVGRLASKFAIREPFVLDVGDFDQTGIDSVVVAARGDRGTKLALLRIGVEGTAPDEVAVFTPVDIADLAEPPGRQLDLKVLDLDEDGKSDLLVVVGDSERVGVLPDGPATATNAKAYVLFGAGGGRFEAPREVPGKNVVGAAAVRTRAGELRDVAVVTGGGLQLARLKADKRTFEVVALSLAQSSIGATGTLRKVTSLAAGDFNGDGVEDLLAVNDGSLIPFFGRAR